MLPSSDSLARVGDSNLVGCRGRRIEIAADTEGTLAAQLLLRPHIDIAVELTLRGLVRRVFGDFVLLVGHRLL